MRSETVTEWEKPAVEWDAWKPGFVSINFNVCLLDPDIDEVDLLYSFEDMADRLLAFCGRYGEDREIIEQQATALERCAAKLRAALK